MGPERERRIETVMTRRRFVAALAVGGASVLAGCADPPDVVRRTGRRIERILDPLEPSVAEGMGPEPAAYQAPAPVLRAPAHPDMLTLECDVCVVGGGAAGVAAAVAAARMDVKTVLVEESFVLGGNTTRGLVNLDKVTWGGKSSHVAGLLREVLLDMEARGEAVYPSEETHFAVPYDADGLRRSLLAKALEAGVDVRLGTEMLQVGAEERRITAVWALEQGRLLEIRARLFVDCTGDGHLGYLAGNGYWLGDRTHGQIQGQTLIFYAAPVDFVRMAEHANANGSQTNSYQVIGLRDFMKKAIKDGSIGGTPQRGLLINRTTKPGVVSISGSETYQDHLAPGAPARIAADLELQDVQIHAALRDRVSGFEESGVMRLAERPYLREGRRLIGYKQLTAEEVIQGAKPEDSIARGWYPIGLHVAYAGGLVHRGSSARETGTGSPTPVSWPGTWTT
ncbi:MAG: FAD-dependent oxidoreductase [Thermoleophilia bacterium]